MKTYYLDTCIWRDFYEDRFGKSGRPLGRYAAELFMKILGRGDTILYSDMVTRELWADYGYSEINEMLNILFLCGVLVKVDIMDNDFIEAKKLSKERKVPLGDAIHAILSRNNNAIMVSQDDDYIALQDICTVVKPDKVI
jgi:hypothetical protein